MTSILDIIGGGRTNKDWQTIAPVSAEHEAVYNKLGPRIGRSIQGNLMHYATGGMKDENGDLWISSYYQQVHRLTPGLEIDYTPAIDYQAPASGDGVAYLQDMCVTTDGSELILACSYGHHCVRVYNRNTGALISTIGVPNGTGALDAGRLDNPHSALRLPNGNIIVSNYNGDVSGTTNRGHITEWDISAPVATFVASRMDFSHNGGVSEVGSSAIYGPMRIIWDNDSSHIWVSEYRRARILKIDPTTWQTVDIIHTPTGSPSIGNSFGLCQMEDGTLVVAANAGRKVIGINPETKAVAFIIDPAEYGGSANTMRGVFEIEPGFIAWSDWSTQMIYVSAVGDYSVQYEAPEIREGYEIVNMPAGMTADFTMTVPVKSIMDNVTPVHILSQKAAT